jgi:hypothetical protein
MLQVEVAEASSQEMSLALNNIAEKLAALELPSAASQLSINAMMKTLSGAKRLSPTDNQTLGQVLELIETIFAHFANETSAKQQDLVHFRDNVNACNVKGQDIIEHANNDTNSARATHRECREMEHELIVTFNEKALAAHSPMTTLDAWSPSTKCLSFPSSWDQVEFLDFGNSPLATPNVGELDLASTALEFLAYYYEQSFEHVDRMTDVTTAHTHMTTMEGECYQHQITFETDYCIFKDTLEGKCVERADCYTLENGILNDQWDGSGNLQGLGQARARQACLLKTVRCLLSNLRQGETDPTACDFYQEDEQMTFCQGNYTNSKPEPDPQAACDTSAVQHGACSKSFRDAEFWDFNVTYARAQIKEHNACAC